VGLGYIHLDRPSPSLSRGEAQRVRIAVSLTNRLEDILHVFDEPTIGQHPHDVYKFLPTFRKLPGPVLYIEHDRAAAAFADQVIDLGPRAGEDGGQIVFQGTPSELWKAETDTGRYFSFREKVPIIKKRLKHTNFLSIFGAYKHNLQNIDVSIPLNQLTIITGVSGSGKSTLVEDVLVPSFKQKKPIGCKDFNGPEIKPVLVDQNPIGKNSRSNPATYTKVSDIIRDLFAQETGLSSSHFSFNRLEGACPKCKGVGAVEVKMRYLPSTWIICSDCDGQRFSDKILSMHVSFRKKRYSIADFYKLSISQANSLFKEEKRLSQTKLEAAQRLLNALETIGLGYLSIGQPSPTLSGGEAQRVKLAKFLGKRYLSNCLIILDEPTTGLHPKDLKGLILVLHRLVNAGATIVVVEHNTDIIKTGDWIIDLGPGAGSDGGKLIYSGPPEGLLKNDRTAIGRSLKDETNFKFSLKKPTRSLNDIIIKGARANNLKNIDVRFKKSALTVVTGVSGSGKSSLIRDVLESEARRRFLETLTLYERQGISEGPEAPVESVSGLGVSVSITPGRRLYRRRSTVGTVTEIYHHLAVLFASIGELKCVKCGTEMERLEEWFCPNCRSTNPLPKPKHFKPSTYSAACPKCNGVGTIQIPVPEKLIIQPEKPLCKSAMYSPGFFPKGYLCKPYNGGYYIIKALAERYNFDTLSTPWKDMSSEAKKAFLYGDPEPLEVTFESRKRQSTTKRLVFKGFYGWVGEWDVGGTYTEAQKCERCGGAGLRPEYLAVKLCGYNIHKLNEMSLSNLLKHLAQVKVQESATSLIFSSLETILKRLRFLVHVGLSYLNLNRVSGTLSAGEAQRIRLAGLLGSELTSLTILLDEPSRGMHPSEVEALISTLKELRDLGNTVIIVEHDPVVIQAADKLVDMGPGPGVKGGKIVAVGELEQVAKCNTVTARWLRNESRIKVTRKSREIKNWLTIKGAKANNLRDETVSIPLGSLVGVCGVSGSGKSTLLIDTIGRALAPKKQTTSVAYEPIKPGEHESIEGAPERIIILDQVQKGIRSPGKFLGLFKPLVSFYADTSDAKSFGLNEEDLSKPCSACRGNGVIRTDMGFLPDIFSICETCRGTGRRPEAWEIKYKGIRFPELNTLTIDEIYELFQDEKRLAEKLKAVIDVGLGYLVLSQPGYSLSGGEAQRLRIAKELSKTKSTETLYILDEPTVGQHMEDIDRLIGILNRLVDEGHSVIVIEHHPHLLAACDWLIELGPGGGPEGGKVIAKGPPQKVSQIKTPTSPYLKKVLEGYL
jgi:excinuclease ABC subunit A